uniref:Basic leucine zipper and W2 domain-containing protein 1-A-like n=1 Tax=Sinocyclocheilus rhinocerous TaxID=307959 RepID=A0A673KK47_9TELE
MNNQKQQKPTLTGQRFKTRKRDEKERFDPSQFQESIVQGLNQTGTDLEAVAKFLDASGAKLDYRRYAETLFDILVAGGMLGKHLSMYCLFTASEDLETMQAYAQVFNKLIRRYKYLEKGFEEEIKKLLLFLKGFTESERNKLAMLTGILLANGNISASILSSLFNENLVKEGVSAAFAVKLFKSWINEKDINSVAASLRKVGMDNRLMELFPANKRSCEHFSKYFTDAGLKELSDFARNQQSIGARKELQKELQEQMSRGETLKDIIAYVREEMKKTSISEQTMIGIVWTSVMSTVEWNKKEELVTEQAIKHLKQYSPLLKAFTSQGLSELTLLLKIQEYCYDNIHFMKAFQKIVVLLYKADVLSEEVILKWYMEAHMAKGKSVFLEQMKKFVEWLKNAEEENNSGKGRGKVLLASNMKFGM